MCVSIILSRLTQEKKGGKDGKKLQKNNKKCLVKIKIKKRNKRPDKKK